MTTGVPDSVFVSPRAKREFWLFCAATFLAFLTESTMSFLSVILASLGMSPAAIGGVLSSPLVPVSAAILFSGYLIERWSPLRAALAGQALSLVAFLSFQITVTDAWSAAGSRIVLGLGLGLFFPAAMVYVKSKLQGPQTAHLFGIYSSMVLLPAVLGPGLAEWYFNQFGITRLFGSLALPMLIGLGLTLTLDRRRQEGGGPAGRGHGYLRLLTMRTLLAPNGTILAVGLVWGFAMSFMALVLHRKGVPTAFFFSSATATVFLSRFIFLRYLSSRPREVVVALSLALMAASYVVIFASVDRAVMTLGGVLCGLGYSMAFPILSVWVSDQFEPAARGRPVALFSTLFHSGVYGMPFVVGALSRYLSLEVLLLVASAGAVVVSGALAGSWIVAAWTPKARGSAVSQARDL